MAHIKGLLIITSIDLGRISKLIQLEVGAKMEHHFMRLIHNGL